MFGVTYEKFARARRDLIGLKKATGAMRWSFWTYFVPRFLVIGFVCATAGIAAFRLMFGTAE